MSLLRRFAGGKTPRITLSDESQGGVATNLGGTAWLQVTYALLSNGVARFETTRWNSASPTFINIPNEWLVNGTASNYDVKYVSVDTSQISSGSYSTLPSKTVGNFYNLGTSQTWTLYLENNDGNGDVSEVSFVIEIYNKLNLSTPLDTATITLGPLNVTGF